MKTKISLTLLFLAAVFAVYGQKMSIGFVYPAGGQRGTSFEIEIGGLNINQATGVMISGKGVKTELLKVAETGKKTVRKKFDDQSSPQLADRLKVRVTIDKNATPGLRDIRLLAPKGVSNKLTFEVGQYTDVRENGISGLQNPTKVAQLPATLCGQIMPGERDYFSFNVQLGTTLVAAVKGRVLVPYIADAVPGWFQPLISLYNSKGREVAFNDDYRNNVDPVIIYDVPETDTYTLMIQDAVFRGREDFNYRIDVGEIPFIQSIYPAAGQKGKSGSVHLNAVNTEAKTIKFKPAFSGKGEFSTTGINGFESNVLPFYSMDKNRKCHAYSALMTLNTNMPVYDSLTSGSRTKEFMVELKKNESFEAVITARKLGSLLDARLVLYNQSGQKVAEADDTEDAMEGLMTNHADPTLKYKATAGGLYKLVLEDVLQGFGADYFYLLERKPAIADFEVFVSPANISIPQGGTAIFTIDILSSGKKIPPLDLEIKGLPRGFLTSNHEVYGNKWEMSVTAPLNAKEQKSELKVLAHTKATGAAANGVERQAVAADNMMQAFYYTHHIPAVGFEAEVTKEAPFSLHFDQDIERNPDKTIMISPNDSVVELTLRIHRKAGFNDPVKLELNRKNKLITLEPAVFYAGETEKRIRIKLDLKDVAKFKNMRRPVAIAGTVNGEIDKKGKRSFENALYRETTPVIVLQTGL